MDTTVVDLDSYSSSFDLVDCLPVNEDSLGSLFRSLSLEYSLDFVLAVVAVCLVSVVDSGLASFLLSVFLVGLCVDSEASYFDLLDSEASSLNDLKKSSWYLPVDA